MAKRERFSQLLDMGLVLGIVIMLSGCGAAGGRVYVGWEHVDETEKHEVADRTWAGRFSRAWDTLKGEK